MNFDIYERSCEIVNFLGGSSELPATVVWSRLVRKAGLLIPAINLQMLGIRTTREDQMEIRIEELHVNVVQLAFLTLFLGKMIPFVESSGSLSGSKSSGGIPSPIIQNIADIGFVSEEDYLGLVVVQMSSKCSEDECLIPGNPMFFSSVPEEETFMNLKSIRRMLEPKIFIKSGVANHETTIVNYDFFGKYFATTDNRFVPFDLMKSEALN